MACALDEGGASSGYLSTRSENVNDVTDRLGVVYERQTVWSDVEACHVALTPWFAGWLGALRLPVCSAPTRASQSVAG